MMLVHSLPRFGWLRCPRSKHPRHYFGIAPWFDETWKCCRVLEVLSQKLMIWYATDRISLEALFIQRQLTYYLSIESLESLDRDFLSLRVYYHIYRQRYTIFHCSPVFTVRIRTSGRADRSECYPSLHFVITVVGVAVLLLFIIILRDSWWNYTTINHTSYIYFRQQRGRKVSGESIFVFLFRKWVPSPGEFTLQLEE